MANIEQLDKAIGAHGLWKTRLRMAIDTGKTAVEVETIRQDNQCVFGKWLYGDTLTSLDKASGHYTSVRALHADFHKTAAHVAELAVAGKKKDAEEMIANGDYARISVKLIQAMMDWKKDTK